ncbi:hypothetical protein GGX14DRAFT_405594 [Mycena pura]|uniref:Uncharacterized protein n=1 Tax=Mycena pura TaxID=153505 RepID=A0AAD6Y0D8_9AGAR|nr:hypothetical protein GGX14DRAFT_405594 [Mycena pura]
MWRREENTSSPLKTSWAKVLHRSTKRCFSLDIASSGLAVWSGGYTLVSLAELESRLDQCIPKLIQLFKVPRKSWKAPKALQAIDIYVLIRPPPVKCWNHADNNMSELVHTSVLLIFLPVL